ncbi:ankyrin repeat domain-containing protein, partial [Lachnospiraceae bacterium OttesenSCG-928-E19]|nr:ankyrin repeat domain-containing protein [Lachnospiraceae bacterium OttesenSCG-928-E19]
MKHIKIFLFALFFAPTTLFAASEFQMAAQLLSAAKNADIQQVQALVQNGANVNFVDNTGLSIVCTALMNNDVRAAQILQMYGADASRCDQQIKRYNQRTVKEDTGGLFGGLSSAQSIALAAAGAAVVVGGVWLLTDVFDPSNSNSGGTPGNVCRPNAACECANGNTGKCRTDGTCDCSGTGTNPGGTAKIIIPYGPAMPNAESESANYIANLNQFSPAVGILADNFELMTNTVNGGRQNYLLMMHGYSPLARGYLGMRTLRNGSTRAPISLEDINLGTEPVMGGRPGNVALVTANGINAADDTSLEDRILLWTTMNNGTTPNGASNDMISSKYYNNIIARGSDNESINDETTIEDGSAVNQFDLSGHGTAINNSNATALDDMLAKIVGGNTAGYTSADFYGFMPNGQMTIFRTGGGMGMKSLGAGTIVTENWTDQDNNDTFGDGDTFDWMGTTLTVTMGGANAFTATDATGTYKYTGTINNGILSVDRTGTGTYVDQDADEKFGTGDILNLYGMALTVTLGADGKTFTATDSTDTYTYNGYIGADGLMYISSANGTVDFNQVWTIASNGDMSLSKELDEIDYANYKALLNAGYLWQANDIPNNGRSRPDVIANASVIMPLKYRNAETVSDYLANISGMTASADKQAEYLRLINKFYDRDTADGAGGNNALPSVDAYSFFNQLGTSFSPLVIFSTGSFETDSTWSGRTLEAGFENAAPIVFPNLEHLFMSVVAVGLTGNGTGGTSGVTDYSPSGKIAVSQWTDNNGTPGDTSDDRYFKARTCGVGGLGINGIDPWCFAAAGQTEELAVASMAGAAGALKSAFNYMDNKQIFALLALTADGPYLATATDGTAMTSDQLKSHLQSMYQLPGEYQYRVEFGGEDYFKVFKEVFGYGLVNLERATKPNTKIYYHDGEKIVSGNGNAYWRAASNTIFRSSSALAPRAVTISAPFFDVLESSDGTLSLPRIWKNEFELGSNGKRGLYMGDVLGELKTSDGNIVQNKIGNLSFSMKISEKPYSDSMGGLDDMQFGYDFGNLSMRAGYQRYNTDGESRFSGTASPIMSLASNTVGTDAQYKMGKWTFGARAYSGAITDESLLQNDPTVSNQYEPGRLGMMQGVESNATYGNDKFAFTAGVGAAHETDTVLGAQTGGLLSIGQGDTTYIDAIAKYTPMSDVTFTARATFANTRADAAGQFILGVTDIDSNAFSI